MPATTPTGKLLKLSLTDQAKNHTYSANAAAAKNATNKIVLTRLYQKLPFIYHVTRDKKQKKNINNYACILLFCFSCIE